MATIKCNGKCNECEAFLNGEIESFEPCAIAAVNRRTFDMVLKISNLEQLVLDLKNFIAENAEKKGKKSVPIKSDDNNNQKNNIEND